MKKIFIILGGVILIAVAFVVISKKSEVNEVKVSESVNINKIESQVFPNDSVSESTPSVENIQTGSIESSPIVVSGGNYYFKPNIIKAKQGDIITITFKNYGGMHNFVIDEFNASTKVIASGAEETITFVADKKGSFEYYCSVGQHRQNGMKGTLIVE